MNIYINSISYSKFFGSLDKPQENLFDPNNVPTQIGKVRFCVKSLSEIQAIADKTNDFLYLTFGNIEITGNIAKIGISSGWVISKKNKGKFAMLSGGGYVWEFKKVKGIWELV